MPSPVFKEMPRIARDTVTAELSIVRDKPMVLPSLDEVNPFVFYKQEKTPCHGKCPVYELFIFSDRTVIFEGKSHCQILGKRSGKLSESDFLDLRKALGQAKLSTLGNRYPDREPVIAELPKTIIRYKFQSTDAERSITNIHDGPLKLRRLEELVEELVLNTFLK